MTDVDARTIASKLMVDRIHHSGPAASSLSDPVTDTPMIVTLDQLQPYDLNPRVTRNPRYDDIKSSIRQRHLDTPPPITRRPGATHFIIRNGGNTRLQILQELWTETRDEAFFRICCLFRPWSERGEIIALTGHLAENELRGRLSFIERACGVEKARELYQAECGKSLSQVELARRLTADGYPITQSQISRMKDAIEYLLPAIPTVLYAGLGRPVIERLTALRKAADRAWERNNLERRGDVEFAAVFQDVLAQFDHDPSAFDAQRVRDELIGQMAQLLRQDYDSLALQILDAEGWLRSLNHAPAEKVDVPSAPRISGEAPTESAVSRPKDAAAPLASEAPARTPGTTLTVPAEITPPSWSEGKQKLHSLSVTASPPPEPTQMPAGIAADTSRRGTNAQPTSVPRHPSSEAVDFRAQLIKIARQIASEVGAADCIRSVERGLGFECDVPASLTPPNHRSSLQLLYSLSAPTELGLLLIGDHSSGSTPPGSCLSDEAVNRLFDLIRLARQFLHSKQTSRE